MSNRQIERGKLILFPKGHQFAGEVGVVVNTVFEEEQIDVYVHSENRIICYDSEEYQDFIVVNGQLSCIFSDALPSSSPFRIEAIFRFKDEAPEEGKKLLFMMGRMITGLRRQFIVMITMVIYIGIINPQIKTTFLFGGTCLYINNL